MDIQHIRNATLFIHYAGKRFLIDPMLAEKGSYPPFPNSERQDQNNPLVRLPISIDNIIENVDAVIITHLHLDHFDDAAKDALPKNIQMFVQNEADALEVKQAGFLNVEVLSKDSAFEGIQLIKTEGQHGRGEILNLTGEVCGVVFKHQDEQILYVAGDTVWYGDIKNEIVQHHPEIIVVNGGDNQFHEGGSLVMGKEDIYEVYKASPQSKIIVVHMEAVNHWTLSREELKDFTEHEGFASQVLVPDDGDSYSF
ncbi:MBL fold metallo-hydrolase [Halobacillus litoralis]|uniref:MBL fold metallo-hydrolase n=1 Tax=Halobacillus litoralis TaxID=45668 RepID=UPI001CFF4D36|nr:MBL fold metallo-hydrolase [Halobacillus litoralis]